MHSQIISQSLTCLKYWSGLVLNRLPSLAEISASKMMP